ncbi:SDR family NAD(P)-dependent oxidoreductase [Azohydromonas australica]|uniref:SDR family NAD(P)-dependent oxidoreductase n=1 Tax=Azohydromonas australica TaxID=364039 RepID=UPI0005BCA216|nr:SDR family oxidoreductase [Azohydromonas australica]
MITTVHPQATAWLGLEGRVCVVTGGGSGIGEETARQLAQAGAAVAVLDRDESAACRVAAEIAATGALAIGIAADVSLASEVTAAAAKVRAELGACQVLVNNAAARKPGALLDMPLEQWNQVLSVNLTGALICTQAFGQQMVNAGRGGSIIHVASIVGEHPLPNGGAYSASKAGMMMLARTLAVELAAHRIRSNVVCPGLVRTPFSEDAYQAPDLLRQREDMIPAGRVSSPLDLANAIVFLASDRSSYVNGQELHVDGGLRQTLMSQVPRAGKSLPR